jgi:hypothetical protein
MMFSMREPDLQKHGNMPDGLFIGRETLNKMEAAMT